MSVISGLISSQACSEVLSWIKDQPLAEVTKSSYVNGRIEAWYALGSNLRSISAGTAQIFQAHKPWQRLVDFGNRLLPGWNSILVCGGKTSIGWHRDHGHFESDAVMLNLGDAAFYELPRNYDIAKANSPEGQAEQVRTDLSMGMVLKLDIKQPHKSEQTSSERYHITWRIIKPVHMPGYGGNVSSDGKDGAQSKGFNIYSRSQDGNGLAAALTNPTTLSRKAGTISSDYPVYLYGATFPDAETAYHELCKQYGTLPESAQDKLMVEVICEKFLQHPRLYQAVGYAGGAEFLATCRHFTYARTERFQAWEGHGLESRFIRNLVEGYKIAVAIRQRDIEQVRSGKPIVTKPIA